MPLRSLKSVDALNNIKNNRLSRWPDGRRDKTRLNDVADVDFKPGFQLEPGEAVFTMGSCFARNIEKHFGLAGFDLPTLELSLPDEERASDTVNDLLNKYPIQSILNELKWALDPQVPFPQQDGLIQLNDESWHDPHLAGNIKPAKLERVLERRAMVTNIYRQIPRCRIVVMTLGLVEAWYDTKTGVYLNTAPPSPYARVHPDRFQLHILSVEEIVSTLREIHAILTRFGHPQLKLLVTVSPVPMKVSFSGQDAIVANSYSKSALRAGLESLVLENNNVDYFPSYEIVTATQRSTAYIQDNRHVTPQIVKEIVDRVLNAYAPPESLETLKASGGRRRRSRSPSHGIDDLSVVTDLVKAGKTTRALEIFADLDRNEKYARRGFHEFTFRFAYGRALSFSGAAIQAVTQFERCIEIKPSLSAGYYNLALAQQKLQRPLDAEIAMRKAHELDPDSIEILRRLINQLRTNGLEETAETMRRIGHERHPDSPAFAPFELAS